jgi:FkbH-like protein
MLSADTSHLDYFRLLRDSKNLDTSQCRRSLRIALLSDAEVPQLVPLLTVLLTRKGIRAEIYRAEYDTIELEVYNEGSGLYAFKADAIVLLHALNALRSKYYQQSGDRVAWRDEMAAKMAALWDTIRSHSSAVILQSTYVLPFERLFGNYDHHVPEAFTSLVSGLNAQIVERARARRNVLINDVEYLASYVGRRQWCDERLWTLCKAFCSLEHLPLVAQNIADILLANAGHIVKCVVVDLDNTLWGGVVGDDGLEGIAIGPFGDGEPFYQLQRYLLELKRRGIVLAVCSKNDTETARGPFRSHPEMVLKEEDFAVFVANWNPKPDNIKYIKEVLNIGLDSMVFLDDNPFERHLVRQSLPEVVVPELPEDPADYVRALSELNLFEATAFSEEDKGRAQQYRENAQRQLMATSFTNLSEYLRSLEMAVEVRRFDEFHLPRIVQLIQRSNQFNLTTRRYNQVECAAMMRDSQGCMPLYVRLSDRLGDSGLISVVICKLQRPVMIVDEWLMSCRVLGRGVEQYTMNYVVEFARRHGFDTIVGTYIPTAKNGMVKEFYRQFGFEQRGTDGAGVSTWCLDVCSYEMQETYMAEAKSQTPRSDDDGAGDTVARQ